MKTTLAIASAVTLSLASATFGQIIPGGPGPALGGAISWSTDMRDRLLASYISKLRSIAADLEDVADGGYASVTWAEGEVEDGYITRNHGFDGMAQIADDIRSGDYRDAESELLLSSLCVDSDVSGYGLYYNFYSTCEKIINLIDRWTWLDEEGGDHKSGMEDYMDDHYSDLENELAGVNDDLENYANRVDDIDSASEEDDVADDIEDYGTSMMDLAEDIDRFADALEVWGEL